MKGAEDVLWSFKMNACKEDWYDPEIRCGKSKSGVAKTTTSIDLSGALADRGNSVLVVDTDSQGYLSRTLGFEDEYATRDPNLADAFKEPGDHPLHTLVEEHAEFDVIPSSVDMF